MRGQTGSVFLMTCSLVSLIQQITGSSSVWADWWAYDVGISGPNYWGILNHGWILCTKGRNQSPVNFDPKTLLFDPSLSPLEINGGAVSGTLINQGNSLTFEVDMTSKIFHGVNFTGGPLSYLYRVAEVRFHFGLHDYDGSEHRIANRGFSAEIQLVAFNSDLYENLTQALTSPRGVVCIAVLVKTSNHTHLHFERIHRALNHTLYKGHSRSISYLNLRALLPETFQYMTYEGSVTHPACHETVTWVVFNKPILISHTQMSGLRRLKQDTIHNPVTPMAGNIRPVQPLNQRTVRTNIDAGEGVCSMARDSEYKVNSKYLQFSYEDFP